MRWFQRWKTRKQNKRKAQSCRDAIPEPARHKKDLGWAELDRQFLFWIRNHREK